jgi:hypothetical protein
MQYMYMYIDKEQGGRRVVSECPVESLSVEGEWPVVMRPLLSSKRRPHFKTHKSLGKNKNMVMGPDGARNHDCLWQGRANSNLPDPTRKTGID